jgi:hypothetical protein
VRFRRRDHARPSNQIGVKPKRSSSHRQRDRQAAIQQLHRVVLSEPEPHAIIRLAAQVYNDASDFEKLRLAIERRANG